MFDRVVSVLICCVTTFISSQASRAGREGFPKFSRDAAKETEEKAITAWPGTR